MEDTDFEREMIKNQKNKRTLLEKMEGLKKLLYPYWKKIENADDYVRKLRKEN